MPLTSKKKRKLILRLITDDNHLFIAVSDNGPGIHEGDFSHGTGLSATMLRLRKLYGDAHDFSLVNEENGGLKVEIIIPVV